MLTSPVIMTDLDNRKIYTSDRGNEIIFILVKQLLVCFYWIVIFLLDSYRVSLLQRASDAFDRIFLRSTGKCPYF